MDTKQKIRVFHALLAKCGALENKRAIIAAYGVESTKDLTPSQLDELIARFSEIVDNRHNVPENIRRWRSYVLTELNKCGIYADNGDWNRVNAFLMNKRVAGKMLYELTIDELKALHKKLRVIAAKKEQERKNRIFNNIEMN